MMSIVWIVWSVFHEYGCLCRLHGDATGNGTMPRITQQRWVLKTAPSDGFTVRPYQRTIHTAEAFSSNSIQHRSYINYKLNYGLRYSPQGETNRVTVPRQPATDYSDNHTDTANLKPLKPKPFSAGANTLAYYDHTEPPLLSLFNIISFANTPCTPRRVPVTGLTGICYREQECRQRNGLTMDVCAGGFGVCCVFQFGCDGQTEQNISYFYAALSPSPASINTVSRCSGTVKLHRHVRQVLLEFVLFELLPPQQGNCREDRFFISVQNSNRVYPVLCGINTGQHSTFPFLSIKVYLDVDAAYSQQLSLMAISNTKQASGTLLVKITQFAHPKSPADCLQFHDGLQGVVKSFNYDDYSTIVKNVKPSYLNNLNYAICIERQNQFCSVVFRNENVLGQENSFQIVNIGPDGSSLVPPNQAGVEILSCPNDFIAINYLRLCGERLNDGSIVADFTVNAPVSYTIAGPVVIAVQTDDTIVGRGFKLLFNQNICLNKLAEG